MGLRSRLRNLLARALGAPESPAAPPPPPPHGVDLFADIARWLPHFRADVVFDVGANVGGAARQYLRGFPEAVIYCFEPVGETYGRLREAVAAESRVRCYQLALGAASGKGTMVLHGTPDIFYLAEAGLREAEHAEAPREEVALQTVDSLCAAEGIARIGYLKIDTEGADLDVLRGAKGLLEAQRIDLVEVEAGMNPGNSWHVPLEVFKRHLEERGYFIFGLYEQVQEWPTHEPHLRRINAVFISSQLIAANRAAP